MLQDVDLYDADSTELENWLKLVQVSNFSVASLKKLKQKFDIGLSELFALSKDSLEKIGFTPQQIEAILHPNMSAINASLQWLNAASNRFLLHFDHPSYPDLLKQISSPSP